MEESKETFRRSLLSCSTHSSQLKKKTSQLFALKSLENIRKAKKQKFDKKKKKKFERIEMTVSMTGRRSKKQQAHKLAIIINIYTSSFISTAGRTGVRLFHLKTHSRLAEKDSYNFSKKQNNRKANNEERSKSNSAL